MPERFHPLTSQRSGFPLTPPRAGVVEQGIYQFLSEGFRSFDNFGELLVTPCVIVTFAQGLQVEVRHGDGEGLVDPSVEGSRFELPRPVKRLKLKIRDFGPDEGGTPDRARDVHRLR